MHLILLLFYMSYCIGVAELVVILNYSLVINIVILLVMSLVCRLTHYTRVGKPPHGSKNTTTSNFFGVSSILYSCSNECGHFQ